MTKFEGKNNLSTIKLAFQRANYKLNAFSDDDENVVDFNFAEKTFYGRVNRMLEPVILNDSFLEPIQDKENILISNFVKDQFTDFNIKYQKALSLNLIESDDPFLSEISPIRGYQNPVQDYVAFLNDLLIEYNEKILDSGVKIKSFEHYSNNLLQYVVNKDHMFKITLSGYMKSRYSSIFHSGLALKISTIRYSDDEQTQNSILLSRNFTFYKNMAKQYGFSLNKQDPTILVSDLEHPVTKKYRNEYDLYTLDMLFNKQYKKTCLHEYELLYLNLVQYYNSLVNIKPHNKDVYICNNKIKSKLTYKDTISNQLNYNLLLLYIKFKNMEEFFPFSDSKIQNIHNTSRNLLKMSAETAFLFIEDQFRSMYNTKDGSLTYYLKKSRK